MTQTQTQVPPALQVLMSMGAQPTAPGPMGQPIPSVAMQKVEQQAQGLEALMPGVRQQAMQSAQAAQPVTQAQLQQALQQRAPGIAGLPAQNMQFADGGVVGYAEGGTPRTYGYAPDYEDARRMGINLSPYDSPEVRKEKLDRLQKMREFEASADRGVAIPTEASQANELAIAQAFSPSAQQTRMRDIAPRPAPPVPTPSPEAQAMMRRQGPRTGIADPRLAAARNAVARTQPRAEMAAPMLPDTRESTAVNPSEAALMFAQMQGGLKELLERQSKPRERTPEELKEAAAREEEIRRRMSDIDASKARFEQAKQERLAGQQGQGLRDLASFLSRAKGPSIFASLGEATLGMEPVFAARAAQEQKFREQELAFMDKLGERRDLVTDMRLASLKDDAGRAREDAARLRALDMEISKLGLGLGEKRMGELAIAERSREEAAARLGQSREEAAARLKQAREEMRSREWIAQRGLEARTAGRGVIPPKDLARMRMQAEQQVDKALQEDAAFRRLRNDPTAQAAYREDKIKARVREALVAADYDLPAGYEKPAAPAGAATRLRFDAQGNPIK